MAAVFGPRSSDTACQKCPLFMTTDDTNPALTPEEQAAVVNAGPTACLTTLGYGYDAATNTAIACPGGTSNAGYNRDPCA